MSDDELDDPALLHREQNVDLVLALTPAPDVDLAQIFRHDDTWLVSVEAMTPFFHRDFECVGTVFGVEKTYSGMDGFRGFELDWLAPWASFRAEVEEAIDVGERVLVLYRVFGRHLEAFVVVGMAGYAMSQEIS